MCACYAATGQSWIGRIVDVDYPHVNRFFLDVAAGPAGIRGPDKTMGPSVVMEKFRTLDHSAFVNNHLYAYLKKPMLFKTDKPFFLLV